MTDNPAMIVVTCACGQKMKVPENAAGKTFKCVRCGEHIKTGAPKAAPTPPATPAPSPADAPVAEEPIGQKLVEAGLVTDVQLQDALAKQKVQGGKTFELLIALGHLDKDRLHEYLSQLPGIANIDLSRVDISPELVKLVPKKLAVENLVLPIDQLGKLLTVAMACPLDVATIAVLERATGLRVKAMLCKLEDIHSAVQKYYPERSKFELSASHFDHILGAAEGPVEKVDDKVKAWSGIFIDGAMCQSLADAVKADASLEQIASRVMDEPTLGAFLMRVANSELYGMPGQIETVPMAVAVMGKSGTLGVLENLIEPAMPRVLEPLHPMVARARVTASMASALARESGAIGVQLAHTVGLLGEIGRMALATISPVKYKRVKSHLFGTELSAAEAKLFSMNHQEAGSAMAEGWRYPTHVVKAIRYYTEPDEAEGVESLARLLKLALLLAYTPTEKLDPALAGESELLKHLNLDAGRLGPLAEDAKLAAAEPKKDA